MIGIAAYSRSTGQRVAYVPHCDDVMTLALRLRERLAQEYDCGDADDLHIEEGSDGAEYVTLPTGETLEVQWGRDLPKSIAPDGVLSLSEAAE